MSHQQWAQVTVRHEYPPLRTPVKVGEQIGRITGFNAKGEPVFRPRRAILGRPLLPGQVVEIPLQAANA